MTRTVPFTAVEDLEADAGVWAVVTEISEFCSDNSTPIGVVDLVRHLAETYGSVGTLQFDDPEYTYVIGPDGEVYEICTASAYITIDDGGGGPHILVSMDLSVVL